MANLPSKSAPGAVEIDNVVEHDDIRHVRLSAAHPRQTAPAVHVRVRRPHEEPHAPPSWMTPVERRELMARKLMTQRSVRVTALSAEFGLSQMTVRRDLTRLEREGRLVRTYGGAIAPDTHSIVQGLPRLSEGSACTE